MSMVDSTREAEPVPPPPTPAAMPPVAGPASTAITWGWLVRAAAVSGVAAAVFGIIVAPGVRGNAGENAVVLTGRIASVLGYLVGVLLFALLARGTLEILRRSRLGMVTRGFLAVGAAISIALSIPAAFERLTPMISIALASAAALTALAGALSALRAPHTRAVGVVLALFAFAAFVRLGSWEIAAAAGERASMRLYGIGQTAATVAVVLEGLGQLTAAAWLGTRGKVTGQLMSSAAIAGAFLLTWGAAQGVHGGASFWQAVMHSALADAAGNPHPVAGITAMATFLVSASVLLALVSVAQPGQVVVVVSALALALLSRGALDAPLRALSVVAAAQWITIAMSDDRAMWTALIESRERRLRDEEL